MVFKRLQSFTRQKQPPSTNKQQNDDISVGESLKSEDCFMIEIPQVQSDKATKDTIFLPFASAGGGQSRDSATSVSSVTTNSGSTRTLRSRSMNEFTRKEKKIEKDKKEPMFSSNSVALTLCHGRTRAAEQSTSPGAVGKQEDDSTFNTMMSCMPSCCGPEGKDKKDYSKSATLFSFSDDRSDIALVDQMDDDTIDPMTGYGTKGAKTAQGAIQNKGKGKKPQQKNKRFLGFMRRTRTSNRTKQ
mmetsp:Transcript_21366/g.35338  ORF Transcript_21366/g.35338 Transcript_21366/m.35338 type:complete len:244 (-) Transcript_21366:180-911(-)